VTEPDFHDYLGDGLYVRWEGYQVKLYSSDGERVLNEVYLDEGVLRNFEEWLARVRAAIAEKRTT